MSLQEESLKETTMSFVWAIVVALLIRTFLYQPFIIPSGSMKPNLMIRDCLFVSKYTYGYSEYAFPLTPPLSLFKGRFFDSNMPKIGDVVVFRGPFDPDVDYIKRVVGLPGDEVQVRAGILYINGKECPVTPLGEFSDDLWNEGSDDVLVDDESRQRQIPMYEETLPNGVKHKILKLNKFGEGRLDDTQVYKVPEGHYFMMGDNRDESGDSRVMTQIGFVPRDNIIGQAEIIWFSTLASLWKPWEWYKIRLSRLLKVID